MDWRDRVKQLMKEQHIKTRNDLSIKAGISGGSLNMALNGTHELKLTTMDKLAEALNTTTRWLLYGDELVEARQVPYLETGRDVVNFISTGGCPDPCHYVQIVHDLSITNRAFAWRNRNNDMEPMFEVGDLLIIDLCKEDDIQINRPMYVMVVEGIGHIDSNSVLMKEHEIVCYIRKLVDSAGRLYFEAANPIYPPISHKGTPDGQLKNAENDKRLSFVAGAVIQRITTYVYENPAKQP